jgi:aldehyde dehydrogenase (NAD+)
MVNQRHYERVKEYMEDAIAEGAKVIIGGGVDDEHHYIEPTVMMNVNPGSALMTQEIFGPVLPLITFKTLEEVVDKVNAEEKPLALYIYSSNRKNINYIIQNTRAGGTCINHNAVHFFNNYLPFGGSNNSGIGKGNGYFGFQAFSNERGVLKQWSPFSAIEMMSPPYTNLKQTLIDLTIKWF